ncbi:MAG TPA: hypothetical protein VGL82_00750, partial [Bryobacteraceae bacterium]
MDIAPDIGIQRGHARRVPRQDFGASGVAEAIRLFQLTYACGFRQSTGRREFRAYAASCKDDEKTVLCSKPDLVRRRPNV